jgi:hypothetical protein
MNSFKLAWISMAIFLCAFARSAYAVDGVVLIDQARAMAGGVTPGDAPGFPVTISRAGSYRLSGSLDVPSETNGIEITAARVTLDLNGFSVRMAGDVGFAFGISSTRDYVAVTNGFVTGFITGVALPGFGARVENLHAILNVGFGIVAGPGSIVRNNVARENEIGVEVRGKGIITGNDISANGNFGLTASGQAGIPGGSTITNNTVAGNGNIGIQVVCPSTLIGNTAVHNTSTNLQLINAASCVLANNLAP